MGGQEECPDASKHVYKNTGILTPASDTTFDIEPSSGTGTRKRKRDGNTIADLLDDAFVVKVRYHACCRYRVLI
jgi:DNA replication regulator SLD3